MSRTDRFTITYQISAESGGLAEKIADRIRVEQTVEMPPDTVPEQAASSFAEILSLQKQEEGIWNASISFPFSNVGDDITQFLNVLYGNISLLEGIKILDVDDSLFKKLFSGPVYGIDGLRKSLNAYDRPLSCTALKPIGLTTSDLAGLAYQFARGGIDIIKDDHGLADQITAPFKERVISCVRAVRKGEQISGKKTLYFPNITTSPTKVLDRFRQAAALGADGVLIAPQLTGLEAVRDITDEKCLPVMAHPAFSGSYIMHQNYGISAGLYFGKLWRALGADAIIFPNASGRFGFTHEICLRMHQQMTKPFCNFRKSFPTPAGGIHLKTVPSMKELYGNDTLFLIGGNLYQQKEGIEAASKQFQQTLENSNEQI